MRVSNASAAPGGAGTATVSGLLLFVVSAAVTILLSSGCNGSGGGDAQSPTGPSVGLTWEAPPTDSDGSALTDLAGFNIHSGANPGAYTTVTDVGLVTEYSFESVAPGTHYFAITAYDFSGNEGGFSEEVVATVMSE